MVSAPSIQEFVVACEPFFSSVGNYYLWFTAIILLPRVHRAFNGRRLTRVNGTAHKYTSVVDLKCRDGDRLNADRQRIQDLKFSEQYCMEKNREPEILTSFHAFRVPLTNQMRIEVLVLLCQIPEIGRTHV